MSSLNKLPKFFQFALSSALILSGLVLMIWSQIKPYQLIVNGETIRMRAVALYARDLFNLAGIPLQPEDRISTDPNGFSLAIPEQISLLAARPVTIETDQGKEEILSAELIPANILQEAGIRLFPEDILLVEGENLPIDQKMPAAEALHLEFKTAKQIDIFQNEHYLTTLFTQKSNYQEALQEVGMQFHEKDRFSPNLTGILSSTNQLYVTKAEPVCVITGGSKYCGLSAGKTVSEALADLNLTPQNLDYAQQAEDQPLPPDRKISLHQLEERLVLQTDETSFSYSYQEDPNTQLDTTVVIMPGQPGIQVSRTTERIQDGTLLASTSEDPWKASDPRDGVMGRGTRAVLQTETVDGETIEFWRKVSVYATSYHPSTFGDNPRTRSGLPLAKGTVAVSAAWYPSMALQRVYVQGYGYGTIGDSGGGIPGTPWIDLGYSDEDYIGWHSWTTLYFLPPIPAWYPVILP